MTRSEVMTLAWKLYRKAFPADGMAQPRDAAARRKCFAHYLKCAWMTVKWEANEAGRARLIEAQAKIANIDTRTFRQSSRDRTSSDWMIHEGVSL